MAEFFVFILLYNIKVLSLHCNQNSNTMPNYVKNELVIVGSDDRVRTIVACICGQDGIDFDRIHPMPEELRNVTSPVQIVSEKQYLKEAQEREARLILGTSGDNHFDRMNLTAKLQAEYIEKFGADNWYEWSCKNWGTKWGACSAEQPHFDTEDENTTATLKFDTAWSCPVPIIEKLSNEYPDVLIRIKYADEDFGSNVGEGSIKCGVWIYENCPESGSKEAMEMADYHWGMLKECYTFNEETQTYEYDESKEG
jgi:hypothetical protein